MTAQVPDNLIINCPEVRFDGYKLYSIREDKNGLPGECRLRLPVMELESQTPVLSTSCYRGYVATFEITSDRRVILRSYECEYYEHERTRRRQVQTVDEPLCGDFWLELKLGMKKSGLLFVPVKNGELVTDTAHWLRARPQNNANGEKTVPEKGIANHLASLLAKWFNSSS